MFTIKVSPQEQPFDVIAIAAEQYKKGMTAQGYNLWYTPYGKPEVWQGVGLFQGDVAYIENAAGKTIDKVEGFESRIAPDPFPLPFGTGSANEALHLSQRASSDAPSQSEAQALSTLHAGAFTQRTETPA